MVDKVHHIHYIEDVACPFDSRINKKEGESITDKYNLLKYEITRLWEMKKVRIESIVVESLETERRRHR